MGKSFHVIIKFQNPRRPKMKRFSNFTFIKGNDVKFSLIVHVVTQILKMQQETNCR